MRGVVDELEVRLWIEVEDRFIVIDPYIAGGHGLVRDDGLNRQLILRVDVVVGGGEHHKPWGQRSILRHLGAEEAIAEHIQRDSCGHVVAPGIDHQIKISPITRKSEVRMTRRTVERIVSRIKSLKHQLPICWIGAELLPDPLELVEGGITEILPLHILFWADLRPGTPGAAISPGKATFSVGKEVPEVFRGAEIGDLVVAIDIPHELPKEVADGHLAECESRESVPQIDLDGLSEDLLVAKVITTHNLRALCQDLVGDFDVLKVEGRARQSHTSSFEVLLYGYSTTDMWFCLDPEIFLYKHPLELDELPQWVVVLHGPLEEGTASHLDEFHVWVF